jgi:ABC-type transport system substrate-binding protein
VRANRRKPGRRGSDPAALDASSRFALDCAVAADVTSIDPHFFNLFPNNNIGEHIFDKLVQMDPDSRMIPGLATSWKTIDDKPGNSSCAKA